MSEAIQKSDYTPQRSAEWFDQRLGLITNSGLYKLMAYPDKITSDSPLPKGAITYIEELFWDLADGHSKGIKAWTLDYGNLQEPKAKQLLANSIGQELADCEFMPHPTMCYYGGSPELEAVVINGMRTTTEIKCPATGRSHHENIEMCKAFTEDNTSLLKTYPELFWQINGNMILQETQMTVFVSYHETKLAKTDYWEYYFPANKWAADIINIQLPKAFKYYKEYGLKHGVDAEAFLQARHDAYFSGRSVTIHDTINGAPVTVHDEI